PTYELDVCSPTRDHVEFEIEALKVQPAHNAVVPLLDQEHPGTGFQVFLYQLELAFGQAEASDVVRCVSVRIREEHLGWRLLDERPSNRARQHIAWALC